MELLAAIAGHDPAQAGQQSRGQAIELATLLQEKQRLLDQRESELNARSALLENDLRNSRLKPRPHAEDQTHASAPEPNEVEPGPMEYGIDLADEATHDPSVENPPAIAPSPDQLAGSASEAVQFRSTQDRWRSDFDEIVQIDSTSDTSSTSDHFADHDDQQVEPTIPIPSVDTAAEAIHESSIQQAESSDEMRIQQRELDEQRTALLKRKAQLDARSAHVDQLYDQVTTLHREALELQLSTESIWSDLNADYAADDLSTQLAETRSRLADHYRLTNETLAQRKDELHELREELNSQESRLRQQRRELQMWADRRYDEIESRTAQLIRRERELDRMEAEFDRQSIQWQQQREDYRQEIERLSWELRSTSTTAAP